jgi:hypothetical protein
MTMHYRTICTILALGLLTSACSSPGTLVVRQTPDLAPNMSKAPTEGSYGLFVAGAADPVVSYRLKQGDPIGFESSQGGTVGSLTITWLYAIAGHQRLRLDVDRSYEWRKL